MDRSHKWSKNDTILTLYYVKYGLNGLPIKSEDELAVNYIGTSKGSLMMQSANMRYILGDQSNILKDFSKMQSKIFDEYNRLSKEELKKIVLNIIENTDIDDNMKKIRVARLEREQKEKDKIRKQELARIFKRMGKDPKKMKKLN